MKLSDLGKRLLFVAWAAPIGWWIIHSRFSVVPGSIAEIYPGHLLAIAIVMMACFEYIRMLRVFYPVNAFWLSYIWIALQIALYLTDSALPASLGIYLLLMLAAIEAFIWGTRDQSNRWARASLFFSGTMFLYVAAISLLSFYQEPFQSMYVSPAHPMISQLGIIFVLLAVFLCDTSAYIVGSIWGKHHFSSISPKKTIEGSAAGFLTSVVVSAIGWALLGNPRYPVWFGLIIGILIGIFAQIGDLLVSLMKRYFHVKDASDIIPGHGGILDRFDSLFFTAPVLMLFFWIINKIAS